MPNCQESAGFLFEARFNVRFAAGNYEFSPRLLHEKMRPTISNFTMKVGKPVPASRTFYNLADLSAVLRSVPNSPHYDASISNTYLQPYRSNLPAIDSLIIYRPTPHVPPRIVTIQITRNMNHPITGEGLNNVFEALPHQLKQYAKMKGNGPILLFALSPAGGARQLQASVNCGNQRLPFPQVLCANGSGTPSLHSLGRSGIGPVRCVNVCSSATPISSAEGRTARCKWTNGAPKHSQSYGQHY